MSNKYGDGFPPNEVIVAIMDYLMVTPTLRNNKVVVLEARCGNCLTTKTCEKEEKVYRQACEEWK